jgi:hypothetical protein
MNFAPGQKVDGFVVHRVTEVELLRSTVVELEHERSGARVLHVCNDDTENLFSITFPTPPPDDTGVPHILEHSVLAGSEKYQSKDSFFELLKSSVATFINAMTASDHTLYPVSSTVKKDLFNLADVYWDAVFHPLLAQHTLLREGHRKELVDKEDGSTELVTKGIVYSEMQGVYSSAESLVWKAFEQNLFPDTAYGRDSGGDPAHIPELTYEKFRAFYDRHYHPSNALIVLYGNLPTDDYLAFIGPKLARFERRDRDVAFTRQPRFSEPREVRITYPSSQEDLGRAYVVLAWLYGDGTDLLDATALALLDRVLIGHHGAPLRKAIIDSKLGEDLSLSGGDAGRLESTFSVGIKGSRAERAEKFTHLVLSTLRSLADGGIERDAIESAAQQLAYQSLEVSSQFPIHLLFRLSAQYVLTGDPIPTLSPAEHLRTVRDRALRDPGYLPRLIRERLLDNPHRLLIIAEGDPDHAPRRDRLVAEALRAQKDAMSGAELDALRRQQEEFDRIENEKETGDVFASLPQLGVSDLPASPRMIPTDLEQEGRLTWLETSVFANGINYLHLDLDLSHVPLELLRYMGVYSQCFNKMGVAGQDYVALAQRIAAHLSGVGSYTHVGTHGVDASRLLRSFRLSTSFLDGHAADALAIIEDLLFGFDPGDRGRLRDVLVQARAQQRSAIASRGSDLARVHAARTLSPAASLSSELHGLPLLRLFEELAEAFSKDESQRIDQTVETLLAIRSAIQASRSLSVCFTGSSSERASVRERVANWATRIGQNAASEVSVPFNPANGAVRAGLAAPMDVGYVARLVRAPHISSPESAALRVASMHFRLNYVLDEVRLKGAAYGGWCQDDPLRETLELGSYRDPQIARTIGVFTRAAEAVQRLEWSPRDVERAILVAAKDSLKPNRPREATDAALYWHVHGLSDEVRTHHYQTLLAVTPEQAKSALHQALEQGAQKASTCVVSSRSKLEAANEALGEEGLAITDIFG